MSYNKIIIYGKRFELYRYEREPSIFKSERKSQTYDVLSDTRNDGSSVLGLRDQENETQKTKRQDNAKRSQMAFRRIVLCNLQGSENPLLFTATYRQNQREISQGFRDFTSTVQALRYKFGKSFKYICVPEFQRRGAIHFHALLWGIPKELLGLQREWPTNSIDCYFWDHGFVFVKETNGHEKIATYLSKYMAKAFKDSRLGGKKCYVASRNINRPIFNSGVSETAISMIKDDWLGVDNYIVQNREYMTQYLGSCNYQLYNINSSI